MSPKKINEERESTDLDSEWTKEALRKSEVKMRSIFRAAPIGIGLVIDRVLMEANEHLCKMTGYSSEALIGKSARILYPSDEDYDYVGREKYRQIRIYGTGTVETRFQRKDGKVIDVLMSSTPLDLDDLSTGVTFTALDITERSIAEKALRESEEKYRRIFENSVVGFFQSTPEGRFVSVNKAFANMLRYASPQELIDGITDIGTQYYTNPEDRQRYRNILQENGYVENYEFKAQRKDGSEIWVSNSTRAYFDEYGQVVRYEGIVMDITQAKQAEKDKQTLQAQLQQAQKFEAIGTLAGGIAHDFNNLLMGILGRTSLMAVGLGPEHSLFEHIQDIETYIQSATDLTNQLLGLARGGKYEIKAIDINELVVGCTAMFGRTRKEISIHTKAQPGPVVAEVDKRQIEQVMLNLLVNAWQAMPDGGNIFIETANVNLNQMACRPHQVEPGAYVKISITDTGLGINETTLHRIFDPFFTTKDKSRGTGLGLASAYGIIKNHDGMITVDSEVGAGSTFTVYLPASEKEAQPEVRQEGKLSRGSETILLVDDEQMIIDVGQAMLEQLGYQVVAAKGGTQAVEVVRRMGEQIDLVVLDMIMPDMGGGKVFDQIRKMQPEIPILLSSGYALDGQATEIMNRGCNGFIQKPFNISKISLKIAEILAVSKIQ